MRLRKSVYVRHHERTGAVLIQTCDVLVRGTDRLNHGFLGVCRGPPWDVKLDEEERLWQLARGRWSRSITNCSRCRERT